ncbi:MAG: monofunctional biosynthetic peptidoglycan transglycosylase [Ignavibacteria bacterium]|nr:monofunctional biosynthetic peptidoglycan transglycosylase [Ignavibacteria bacterium]
MIKTFFKWMFRIIIGFIIGSVLLVAVYIVVNPPFTPLMVIRVVEGWFGGKSVGITKTWKSYDEISPNVFRSLMAGEDGKFLKHNGFDWQAIERAKKVNAQRKGKRLIGASTISMQTSKNVFLWQGRNYVRKGLEAYFTVLIEALWGKKRILEVYANCIEWGDGIYGVEAASQAYFGKSCEKLSNREAALLAAIVPNPRKWSAAKPTSYIQRRASMIQARAGGIPTPKK